MTKIRTRKAVTILVVMLVVAVIVSGLYLYVIVAGSERGTGVRVSFDGTIEERNDSFVMMGELSQGGDFAAELRTFDEVRILLYGADWRVIATHHVGSLEADRNVSVTSSTIPRYVVITSPDFWGDEDVVVTYYEHTDEGYTGTDVPGRADLPVALPTEEEA